MCDVQDNRLDPPVVLSSMAGKQVNSYLKQNVIQDMKELGVGSFIDSYLEEFVCMAWA